MDPQSKKKLTTREQREAERFRGSVAEYSLDSEDSAKKTSFIKNISIKGVCIVNNREIEMGTLLYLTIYLPGIDPPIKVKGKTIWQDFSSYFGKADQKYHDLGIEFVGLSDFNLERLIQLLHIEKPYRP